jgi:benzoyl-CoA reductase subunit D
MIPTDFDIDLAARTASASALANAGLASADKTVVTGAGRDAVGFADIVIGGIMASAKGAYHFDKNAKLVIDLGADGYRAISIKESGAVAHYESNDRCAAGSGTFIETMARTLQLGIDEMSECALRHKEDLTIASQCVVFAESEVVSLIHQNHSVNDIAFGVIAGVANRVATVAKRESIKNNIILIGGLGGSKAMLHCLSRELGRTVTSIKDPEYITAIGAVDMATAE